MLTPHGSVAELSAVTVRYRCSPGPDDIPGAVAPGGDDPLYQEPQPGRECIHGPEVTWRAEQGLTALLGFTP